MNNWFKHRIIFCHRIKDFFKIGWIRSKLDFKIRNEGSFLGIVWYLLEPIAIFVIISLIRQQGSFNDYSIYPVYLFAGLIIFNFFSRATNSSISAINSNLGILKNVKFPPEPLIISKVLDTAFSHFFEILILSVLMVFFQIPFWHMFFYLLLFIVFFAFTLGVSLTISSLAVFVKDLNNVWSVLMRILWFATPIFYMIKPTSLITSVVFLNPLFHFVEGLRSLILWGVFSSWLNFIGMLVSSFLSLWIGFFIFGKLKNKFAESA